MCMLVSKSANFNMHAPKCSEVLMWVDVRMRSHRAGYKDKHLQRHTYMHICTHILICMFTLVGTYLQADV